MDSTVFKWFDDINLTSIITTIKFCLTSILDKPFTATQEVLSQIEFTETDCSDVRMA